MVARIAAALLGAWLMAAPAALSYGPPVSSADRVVGPVVLASSLVAVWPVLRSLRWPELPAGVWLLIEPWVLGAPAAATINALVIGGLLIALAPLGGAVEQRFGGGWKVVWRA